MHHPDPAVFEFHFMPLGDCGTHAFDMACACGPINDCPGSIIHQSYDGREYYEQGHRKPH